MLTYGLNFWIVFFLGLLSIIFWIIVRYKRQRLWLPIISILESKSIKPPSYSLKRPYLIPFLLFLLSLIALCLLVQKPQEFDFLNQNKQTKKIHLLFDMSPSVSKDMSLETYLLKIEDFIDKFSFYSGTTYSTSHGNQVFSYNDKHSLIKRLKDKNFDRKGFKVARSIIKLNASKKNIDNIIVVGDRDYYSWLDVHYNSLYSFDKLFFYDIGTPKKSSNVFIEKANLLTHASLAFHQWEIHLVKAGELLQKKGILKGYLGKKLIGESTWEIAENEKKHIIHIRVPSVHVLNSDGKYIKWEITPENNDAITMDNIYYSHSLYKNQPVVIHSSTEGENPLEDPARDLSVLFRSFGFPIIRKDNEEFLNNYHNSKLEIFIIGEDFEYDKNKELQKTATLAELSRDIWLAPRYLHNSREPICNFLVSLGELQESLDYGYVCETMKTQEKLIPMLTSSGFEQVGGELGGFQEAFAWQKTIKNSQKDLIVFSIPLKTDPRVGMPHSYFPIVIHDILSWKNLITKENEDKIALSEKASYQTNVSFEESLMRFKPPQEMPSKISLTKNNQISLISPDSLKDSYFWIKILLLIMIFCVLLESVFLFLKHKKQIVISFWFAILCFLAIDNSSYAKVKMALIRKQNSKNIFFKTLKSTVENRTTIEIDETPSVFTDLTHNAFKHPWLWISINSNSSPINKKNRLELIQWIKSGGLLVIENDPQNFVEVASIAEQLSWIGKPAKWGIVHQDHELMKSFYLLNTLPTCNDKTWMGMTFDKRLAIIMIPFSLTKRTKDSFQKSSCYENHDIEVVHRSFVNLAMVALTTDYKNDQVHVYEILKRIN